MTPETLIKSYNALLALALPYRPAAEVAPYAKLLDEFVVWLKLQNAGDHYVQTYLSKVFSYYLKGGKVARVNPRWVFGKTMRSRYANELIRYDFPEAEALNRSSDAKAYELDVTHLSSVEESERELHYGTDLGLFWCSEQTTMYHPDSTFCTLCDRAEECREIQREQYPTLADSRQR